MKNIIVALVLCLLCSSAYAGSCSSGTCGSRVASVGRAAVSTTVEACSRVVSAPVRVTRTVVGSVRSRRAARVARRNCCN
jgi:hypothetical protein